MLGRSLLNTKGASRFLRVGEASIRVIELASVEIVLRALKAHPDRFEPQLGGLPT